MSLIRTCQASEPDAHRTLCEIIHAKGPYQCKEESVTTLDGYILQVFRMQRISELMHSKLPVLMWHGLLDSAFTFLLNMANESLPYLLADEGYDVWLGNCRGNTYGTAHMFLDPRQEAFWQFTWDAFAQRDVPDVISHVLYRTALPKLAYVAHSQGTMQMFAALSAGYVQSSQLACFVALGPVIFASHQRNPILTALSSTLSVWLGRLADKKAFKIPAIVKPLVDELCKSTPRLCSDIIELIAGVTTGVNDSRVEVIATHEPGGTSTLNLAHWAQMVRTGKFRRFDYGPEENPRHYNGSLVPPSYNISNYPIANVPTAIFSGEKDILADPEDVDLLLQSLPPAPWGHNPLVRQIRNFGHLDFVWDISASEVLYRPLVLPFIRQTLQSPYGPWVLPANIDRTPDIERVWI